MNIVLVLLKLVEGLPTSREIMCTTFEVKSTKVKVTRPTNAETESESYLPNGKAYKLQTWYTDAARRPLIITADKRRDLQGQIKVAMSHGASDRC